MPSRYTPCIDALSATAFRRDLRRWYRTHGRHQLPWRHTRDPYAVLLSEVMLQQTQVGRVEPYFATWMRSWPDAVSLAAAAVGDVIRVWAGLGYNRRAVALHRAAVVVTERFEGHVPVDRPLLLTLPGVGAYTAGAVACFAGGAREAFFDTNIARVLVRARLGIASPAMATRGEIHASAEELLPRRGARDHNLALMDLGATVCLAGAPRCGECPVARRCAWLVSGRPAQTVPTRKLTPRFETTARFARGRLVAALREHPMRGRELQRLLPPAHQASTGRYLASLEHDGLAVSLRGGWWALPGTTPWPGSLDARDPQGVDYSRA